MVSFSCEVCNDTLIKKKLNGHFQRCPNAYFTCIDCNTTFQGNEFEKHTSCITEDQKYQGKLYKAKPVKTAQNQETKSPKPAAEKNQQTEPKKAKSSSKAHKIDIKTTSSLYKIVKNLKKSHKLDTKKVLKKLQISPDGTLELDSL